MVADLVLPQETIPRPPGCNTYHIQITPLADFGGLNHACLRLATDRLFSSRRVQCALRPALPWTGLDTDALWAKEKGGISCWRLLDGVPGTVVGKIGFLAKGIL